MVSRVAVARVTHCASSSMRRTPSVRPRARRPSSASGTNSSIEAAWDGTTSPKVVRKERSSSTAYVDAIRTPAVVAPAAAIANSRHTSLTSRRRRPMNRMISQPTRATSTESARPSSNETPKDRPIVKLASAKATVSAARVAGQLAPARRQEGEDPDPGGREPGSGCARFHGRWRATRRPRRRPRGRGTPRAPAALRRSCPVPLPDSCPRGAAAPAQSPCP